ncbi:MAG: hypothetical protein R3D26_18075 [Cyanobacteriota/Melainabacteria group bacterium]
MASKRGLQDLHGFSILLMAPSHLRGKPVFGTLIGLACQGEFELGIIDQAVLDERFLGLKIRAPV